MKFLIISNNYPPLNDGGVPRILALEKFLKSKKVEVKILTNGSIFPKSSENNIIRIYDSNYTFFKQSLTLKIFNYSSKVIRVLLLRCKVYISYNWVWLILAKWKITPLVEKEKFDYILVSYPTIEVLSLGKYLIETLPKTKLIVDYRDPLVFETAEFEIKTKYPRKFKKLSKLELFLLKHSFLTLTIAPQISNYLKKTYPLGKISTVTNGYDDLSNQLNDQDKKYYAEEKIFFSNNKITFLYTGTLTHYDKSRKANHLLDSIRLLPKNFSDKVQFIFYGKNFVNDFNEYEDLLSRKIIILRPEVSRHLSTKLQGLSDILLLITNTDRTCVTTGKIFEYLQANKPILGLTKNTHAEQIISSTKTGLCVSPNNSEDIKNALLSILNFDIQQKDNKAISEYSRENQFNKLWESLY